MEGLGHWLGVDQAEQVILARLAARAEPALGRSLAPRRDRSVQALHLRGRSWAGHGDLEVHADQALQGQEGRVGCPKALVHRGQAGSLGRGGTILVVGGTACYRSPEVQEEDHHDPIDQAAHRSRLVGRAGLAVQRDREDHWDRVVPADQDGFL